MQTVNHWFHRNPLKSTAIVSFDHRTSPSNTDAMQICHQLRQLRLELLQSICNPMLETVTIRDTFDKYISLLTGFITPPEGGTDDSKLRYTTKFYWSDSLTKTDTITDVQDAQFEICCMTLNIAMWYTKHAAYVASKSSTPSDKDALDIHKSLRIAAGMFKHVMDVEVRKLHDVKLPACSDVNDKVLAAYYYSCLGEFHEVTVARAMNAKQDSALISSISNQIAQYFEMGGQQLSSLDEKHVGQWRMYFGLKSKFYLAEARAYQALDFLKKNDAPNALKAAEEASKVQQQAASFCEQYSKTKGAGSPQRHPFFLQLDSLIRRVQSTVEFENNVIHHKRAAAELLPLDTNPTHGILPAEEYIPAKLNSLFTPDAYRAFDIGRNVGKPYKEDKHARDVKEVREMPIPQGMPTSDSACTIA
ncbi:unnamed protein product [Adineta steineri]|uniref:BRO1 domain-containing protein n=1 Tax=Adineta steineri TaxID=433720 RepID=A0A815CHK4_9BILA|nr:unnamed protein product [Adineta steineri]CAF1287554.1 unnamed protein product [Adineta steineri]CAF3810622.1 unnamed protein product [Adineta steineri]CAF4042952.1 unnamed protein product [Adineta steineri]